MLLIGTGVCAQVGINTALPDTSSVLDLSGPDNTTRGLLIPAIDAVNGKDLVITPRANGLLLFDSLTSEFYFWQSSDQQWYSLNRWKAIDKSNHIYTLLDSVGIGTATPSEKLDVAGNSNVVGKVKEYGNDLLPAGSIIMWSGNVPPAGWGICDGTAYLGNDGGTIQSPDLQGRFVTGAGGAYGAVNASGNVTTVNITANNLPTHTHTISNDGTHTHNLDPSAGSANRIWLGSTGTIDANASNTVANGTSIFSSTGVPLTVAPDHNHGGATGNGTGLNGTALNIPPPPYYVLAYIIKL
ncbi:MAG: tail fiber protein [Bacteroidetes bacterium]|nr:tail fiber protein [Bacteroidota bacterium]